MKWSKTFQVKNQNILAQFFMIFQPNILQFFLDKIFFLKCSRSWTNFKSSLPNLSSLANQKNVLKSEVSHENHQSLFRVSLNFSPTIIKTSGIKFFDALLKLKAYDLMSCIALSVRAFHDASASNNLLGTILIWKKMSLISQWKKKSAINLSPTKYARRRIFSRDISKIYVKLFLDAQWKTKNLLLWMGCRDLLFKAYF